MQTAEQPKRDAVVITPHSPAFKNSDTQYEREEQLVLLEQRSTDVAVDAAGEVKVQNLTAFRQVVALLADDN